ncbi:MAG: PaaI family thioesterase [Sulfurifustaceae bacterium]
MAFVPANPNFARDVERTVQSLPAARLLGFRFAHLGPGEADLELPFRDELSAHCVFQGGIIGALADFAGGSAAGTLLAPGSYSVTADYTIKLLAPALGEYLLAQGRVLHAGNAMTVARAEVYTLRAESRSLCATALVTMRNFSSSRLSETS